MQFGLYLHPSIDGARHVVSEGLMRLIGRCCWKTTPRDNSRFVQQHDCKQEGNAHSCCQNEVGMPHPIGCVCKEPTVCSKRNTYREIHIRPIPRSPFRLLLFFLPMRRINFPADCPHRMDFHRFFLFEETGTTGYSEFPAYSQVCEKFHRNFSLVITFVLSSSVITIIVGLLRRETLSA